VGSLVCLRDTLRASVATVKEKISKTIEPLQRDVTGLEAGVVTSLAADAKRHVRDTWLMVLGSFLPPGMPPLHPLEVDAAVAAVTAAIKAHPQRPADPAGVVRDALLRHFQQQQQQ
jgi:hypothetical protein